MVHPVLPRIVVLAALAVLQAACTTPAITNCAPANGLTPDCRFENPEDFAASPAGTALLVSEMGRGSVDSRRGRILSYRPGGDDERGEMRVIWPRADGVVTSLASPGVTSLLGDPACPALPPGVLAPHGIDLERLDDGRYVLYVVNHASRESIEIFEVVDDGREVALRAAGCVLAPENSTLNDVVALRDGGFRVSNSFPASDNMVIAGLRMRYGGYRPGFALEWRPGRGYTRIAGTDVAYANGIEKSPDERYVYLNGYFEDVVVKVDTVTGQRVGSAAVTGPDNITWSNDGRLLVASQHAGTADLLGCLRIERGACGFRFEIVELDPQSMSTRTLLDQQGPPIGAVTVALPFDGKLYLGTFAGDRIAWR